MRNIKDLINCNYDINITGITDDSRNVLPGFLYVATKGFNVDHFDFIDDAINNGCVFIISDRNIEEDFPHLVVDNINDIYIELCKKYYDLNIDSCKFIGITGTDGKTTTASIIREIINDCAYIGTNGLRINDNYFNTNNTTPCIPELCQDLKKIIDSNINNVVMEVSSEALLHDRVKFIKYDIVAFTNVTEDHLNVHKTFDNYYRCKMKLLDLLDKSGHIVINGDDENLCKIKHNSLHTLGFGLHNEYVIKNVTYNKRYTIFDININDNIYTIESPFIGEYNIYNVAMAFIICKIYGIEENFIINKIKELGNVAGRCEFLDFNQNFDIVLDYAHTFNGIKSILSSFNKMGYNKIIVVTGCAGGREVEKRRLIGEYIINNCFLPIFTMDDPRFEDVNDIIDQMVGNNKDYIRIIDRKEAIHYALSVACENSVVLILGKGRDNYMAIDDKKIEYCDYDVIKEYYL